SMPSLAGKANGLRHWYVFHVRRKNPPGRRRLGLQTELRRWTGVRRREDPVVSRYFAATVTFVPPPDFAARIKWASRDFVRAAALGWIDRLAPALSSFLAANRSSVSAVAISPVATAWRTLRTCVLMADLIARFL